MRVVALISGGKDSVLSVLLAEAMGHECVATAHLEPRNGADETDSYMYQSVGSNVATFMGTNLLTMPFFKRRIQGTPIDIASNEYSGKELSDEVEDLYHLISQVKEACAIEGIVTGAILSTYQKRRVENVCDRLGLVSIAPLWRWPQTFLLGHLTLFWDQDEFDVRLIKVATLGLHKRHLLQSLHEMKQTLIKLYRDYQVNVCGEGGEFESLVVRCPLFSNVIDLQQIELLGDPETRRDGVWYAKAVPVKGESRQDSLSGCDHPKARDLRDYFQSLQFYEDDCGVKLADWARESPSFFEQGYPPPPLKVALPSRSHFLVTNGAPVSNAERQSWLDGVFCTGAKLLEVEDSSSLSLYAPYNLASARVAEVWASNSQRVTLISDVRGHVPHYDPGSVPLNPLAGLLLCWRTIRNTVRAFQATENDRLVRIQATISLPSTVSSKLCLDFSRVVAKDSSWVFWNYRVTRGSSWNGYLKRRSV
eukprot:Protomagalhaensia_sp_Gyna_25__4@NODE_1002_length_2307_cov_6_342152_g798_i0_p1_GENE_NODE_1002_length_2307_cov_6_342152_g798_i0NODE_1002_length_2307_cov_6_342152_g798_i0_p1_ORF_typecomplete_len478_score48_14Diphthami_syn_2/PF01902_17/4e61ThiI/PF02568_14/0_003tRNA_Me_trans/PF03054_16/0_063QueC/PF06508_13/0_1PAPS_reduct/PF01507_19/0_21PAPS_reduct/PF01507_19/5_9e03NAD_synthase/PF02540_17/0_61NAD_synthase/PF02540_17/8_5e02_NODE_1002_length_2307_cov_6_342152_g798_i02891722